MRGSFELCMAELLKHEGGYVDHPQDPGGATNMGITIKTLEIARGRPVTKSDVKALTLVEVKSIYRALYWDKAECDKLPYGVDAVAFDIAVNAGVGRWRQWRGIITGLSPPDAVRALSERRRRFYRSLKTFPTFGKGWMRRVNEVEKFALSLAEKNDDGVASSVKEKSMATSKTGAATILTGAAGTVAVVKEVSDATKHAVEVTSDAWSLASSIGPWVLLGIVIVAAASFIWYDRRKKMVEHGI